MARTIKFLVLVALVAVVAFVIARLKSSTQATAALGGDGELPGSLDTWPEVPVKQVA
jgi:hypothetical protein